VECGSLAKLLRRLPMSELFRLNDTQIAQYIEQDEEETGA
jgi:hypothetical protein